MQYLTRITSDPYQKHTIVLDDGTSFILYLYFRPMQQGWFAERLEYPTLDFLLPTMRICNSPNMLYQWQNKLPFGLACFSAANREPSLQDDFISGASKLYVLTEAEVQEYTDYIQNG